MNIYLLSQTDTDEYDTYDSCVVAAPSDNEAKDIHPSGNDARWEDKHFLDWAKSPDRVTVKLIGTAVVGTEYGVICASYNAG